MKSTIVIARSADTKTILETANKFYKHYKSFSTLQTRNKILRKCSTQPTRLFPSTDRLILLLLYIHTHIEQIEAVTVRQTEFADQSLSVTVCYNNSSAFHFMCFTSSKEQTLGAMLQQP